MAIAEMKFIKRCAEFCTFDDRKHIPPHTRGIYVLLKKRPRVKVPGKPKQTTFDVAYIGMVGGAGGGIKGRIRAHIKHERKRGMWTHFSIYEVHDNVTQEEVKELEGLFRHTYRLDTRANKLNKQKGYKKLRKVRSKVVKMGTYITV